jgi:toxin ParE1/3/4
MARPRFTTEAYRDLDEILRYISSKDPNAAIRVIDRLEAECWGIARNPGIGQPRRDLALRLRFFPVGNYLIFYREEDEGIQVIRILHGAQAYGSRDF